MSVIVFGWYSFKIKSFTQSDLGLEPIDVDIEYQVRQKVFHIMYVPVFPIGKIFATVAQDRLQPVSEVTLQLIKNKVKVRTPWYSFSVPLLLCVSLFVFYAHQEVKDYLYRKHVREEFSLKQTQISNELEHLTEYHYIELRQVDNWITSTIYYLKIEDADATRIYASKIESGIGIFDSPRKVRETYTLLTDSLTKISISRNDFEKLKLDDPEVYLNRMTYGYKYPMSSGFDLFGDGKRYVISDIHYFNGPVLSYSSKSWSSRTGFELFYDNYGDNVRLTRIENLEGFSTQWNTEFPLYTGDHFSISATDISGLDSKYGIQLTFEDSLNNVFMFKAYKYGVHEVVERLIPSGNAKAIVK